MVVQVTELESALWELASFVQRRATGGLRCCPAPAQGAPVWVMGIHLHLYPGYANVN